MVALRENPHNFLIMHAMGPNLAGVFGTAISGGIMLALLGVK
jgi:oxaloacetate decarboxylase beta subunit